jgi:hypothetical protein
MPGGHGDDHATGRQIQVDGASMASSVSLRKMSTVWSMRRAGAHPNALGRRGGRVVTTTVEEPPGDTTPADGARRGRGRPLASLGATGTWGRIGCRRVASRVSSFPTALFADELRDILGVYVGRPADARLCRPAEEEEALGKQNARLQSQRHHHSCSPPSTLLDSMPASPRASSGFAISPTIICRQDRSRGLTPPSATSLDATQDGPTRLLVHRGVQKIHRIGAPASEVGRFVARGA